MKRFLAFALLCACAVSFCGCKLQTAGSVAEESKDSGLSDVNDLESGKAYVWHDSGGDVEKDLSKKNVSTVFFPCVTGDYNFEKSETDPNSTDTRSIWFTGEEDSAIPTVTSEDKLIYVSDSEVPDTILFERFADYGYSIGVSNLTADEGDHYYLLYQDSSDDDYAVYIDPSSDAMQLTDLSSVTRLYLDRVGEKRVTKKNVTKGGTVSGLKKGKSYTCTFYTGTYYQDFEMTANVRCFGSLESFESHDYEFAHSNFIIIDIPDYFVSGYYFVNGVGLFRYVSDSDAASYNGKTYDSSIDWNDPMILYDDIGNVVYDPSDPDLNKADSDVEVDEDGDVVDSDPDAASDDTGSSDASSDNSVVDSESSSEETEN